jgi:hypothetical protein
MHVQTYGDVTCNKNGTLEFESSLFFVRTKAVSPSST